MTKVFAGYWELRTETLSLCGCKVKIYLGGDYYFLDDCLGHQWSSATYPSAKDLQSSAKNIGKIMQVKKKL